MTKTLLFAALLLLSGISHAGNAFLVGEVDNGGMYKQCVYDYLGETFVITISSVKLCPLSIRVDR